MRLADRILQHWSEQEVDFPGDAKDYEIRRTHAGHWQRSRGAWSWVLINYKIGHQLCGSQYTATECVKKGFNIVNTPGGLELWPLEQQP